MAMNHSHSFGHARLYTFTIVFLTSVLSSAVAKEHRRLPVAPPPPSKLDNLPKVSPAPLFVGFGQPCISAESNIQSSKQQPNAIDITSSSIGRTADSPIVTHVLRDKYDKAILTVSILSVLSSMLLALLVFRFTNVQARTQTLMSVQAMWQAHNFDILTNESSMKTYRKLFSVPDEVPDETIRIEYMVFIWMNILYMQWESDRNKLIRSPFAKESISDAILRLVSKHDFIIKLLQERGYDDEFIRYIESLMTGTPEPKK